MTTRKAPIRPSRAVQRLRRRLREAEDTLEAIRSGHVEALVVSAPNGEQIYTLHSADQPYRLMVEQMREGALTLAADGTILYCNRRFEELLGLPSERLIGRPLSPYVARGHRAAFDDMLAARLFRDEFVLHTSAGVAIPVQMSSTALDIEGVRTVAVVVTDLTPEQITRGLRELNRLKDEFLATLSHELRTPLNVILGWARMLQAGQLADTSRAHAIELIERNAQAQVRLVNDLVDMSRMTTGKLRLELQPLPLVPALEGAVESVRPAAQAKGLTIETAWRTQGATVLADPTRFQQVMWNLLANAVKFTAPGGRITVTSAQLADRVRIVVADTGIGIDGAFLPHVFDRFRQADGGTARSYSGLGLGLAIVHDLIQLHGGDVEAQSPGVGLGSTFIVTLRTSEVEEAPAKDSSPKRAEDLADQRIMA